MLRTDLRIFYGEKLGPAALLPGRGLVDNAAQPHRHRLLGVPAAKRGSMHIVPQPAILHITSPSVNCRRSQGHECPRLWPMMKLTQHPPQKAVKTHLKRLPKRSKKEHSSGPRSACP